MKDNTPPNLRAVGNTPTRGNITMVYRVSYEHSLASDPDAFIADNEVNYH